MEHYELPENTYTGFGSIGGSKREKDIDPIENLDKQEDQEESKQELKEDVDHYDLHDIIHNGLGDRSTKKAGYLLQDYAKGGMDHQDLIKAAKHIETESEVDAHLEHTIRSASKLTPEIHEHVRQTLRKEPDNQALHSKYSWVFHHPDTHAEVPVYDRSNAHLHLMDEEHVRKYHKDFNFVGGRTLEDKITGSTHHINQDGSLSPSGRSYNQLNPLGGEMHGESVEYYHDLLSHHFSRQLDDLPKDHNKILGHFTEDSVPYNKATAKANKGIANDNSDKMYIGSETHEHAHMLDSAIKNLDPAPVAFKVYTGLSKSTDPTKATDTSEGRKTMHLPAFTSTSLHARTAQGFARPKDSEFGRVHDIMEINIPKYHTGGAYIDTHSANAGEHEYLLTHGHVVEHDAKPKYWAASPGKMYRVWGNGEIKGLNQHPDWKHMATKPEEMTPEVTKQMEASHIDPVRHRAVYSQHASNTNLVRTINEGRDKSTTHAALSHPNLNAESLMNILNSESRPSYFKSAIKNPNFGEDHALATMTKHPNLAADALSHENVPSHVALMASSHPSPEFRRGAALSGKLSSKDMEKLANDPHSEVSYAAKLKIGKVEENLEELINQATSIILGNGSK